VGTVIATASLHAAEITGTDAAAMPPAVVKQVADMWKADVKDASGKAVW
jgi:phosphate transport system substrate-binding protein